ncbi:hypothetical protein HO133_009035 [Letharia lupina]|uniref:Uncharacterized protein n=1 Tax=Letharia lupina TaxID=560253 RepID=A0A8H6CMD2_9LECA|nr:uncharacterized protein HO133_009035 [Letharia lupina]KAF6226169.1 hypothetical protein HO133_009035 [Letharia lupina]
MLLTIFVHFSVFILVSGSHILLQKRQGSFDITRSGRYTIANCGNRDAAGLVNLLETLWAILQPSIRDSSLPISPPSPAFRTFFHSATNAPYVRQLLTNVTTGVSLYPPEQPFHQTGSPLFICATGVGQIVGKRGGIDYYYQCLLDPYNSFIAIGGTPYIVVCPYLFSSGVPDSPPADTCLTVNTSVNRFRGMGLDFAKFKVWALLEGILRYYIYATTGSSGIFATDVNKCVRLGSRQMVENPSNYVYYTASIYGQCRDFPDLSEPRRRPLENTTLPDPIHADDERPNTTSSTVFAVSGQAVVVDPSGSMDI